MDQIDIDLQGTDGSGSLGGPDVRRQIPIKLLSKQAVRSKPPVRPQRSTSRLLPKGDEEGFSYKQEERFECKSGDAFGSQRRFPHPCSGTINSIWWERRMIHPFIAVTSVGCP
ncbi:hypothetical protein AALO_G00159390 [Alosa alosa]|uniref:Uncharacterized protein n=1 Tax=Alosa alosa TaxID=278164 RepID=A0AAV6GH41_9TELE|nr:hypothetical protein AALO_G00159390 [Alosa alosa]